MGLGKWLSETLGGSAGEIIESVGTTADKFIQTKEEKAEFQLALLEAEMKMKRLAMEAEMEFFKDRDSARTMQQTTKSKIPGVLTIVFTVGYFSLTAFMLFFLLGKLDVELSQFVTVFISTIFGAFNAIMVQIISFYFGSSNGGEDQGSKMIEAFNTANKN